MNINFNNLSNTFSNNYSSNNQNTNINRINNINKINNLNENKFSKDHYGFNTNKLNKENTSSEPELRYTSLDGRKWENYDSMVRANMEIYNKTNK